MLVCTENFLTPEGKPKADPDQPGLGLEEDEGEESGGDGADPLYSRAVAFVRETNRANISAIQRKLRIGYNRAARLIERMEEEGVVLEMDETGQRQVAA